MNNRDQRSKTVRVVLFGYGSVGVAVTRLCATRAWIDIVGIVTGSPRPDESHHHPFILVEDVDRALDELRPHIAIIATRSTISDVIDDIERCARRGISVICSSEQLAHPQTSTGLDGANEIAALAQHHGVSIAATGINPGFVFDALPLAVAGAAWDLQVIRISRTLDASVFGRDVHRSLGVGYEETEFRESLAQGIIHGHIGFEESAGVIAAAVGQSIEGFEEKVEPVFTEVPIKLRDYRIEPGQTAGVNQSATAIVDGVAWLEFDLSLHVAPDSVGLHTRDRIVIEGKNTIELRIEPGTQAVLTTSAMLVNAIPAVLRKSPGLYNSAHLLPSAPWLGSEPPPS